MKKHMQWQRRALVAALFAAGAGLARAQGNVTKVVVPFPAGGVTDRSRASSPNTWRASSARRS
ncbi:hypothetical protein HK414_06310 [Ramlibacter terrae]|uniref:Tripartite tricarboxylate transporter substrate binding protein n=1 Tax=Ramlibacter terrae TaxID=2732511 RepID=A0ABX6P422_9BURK|nr:hypothetical protein HK414_06310 [Ramlibacter terrae]